MKIRVGSSESCRLTIGLVALTVLCALSSPGGLRIPYTPDESTLHLWHLDGGNSLTTPDAVTSSPITLTNIGWPTPGTMPYTNTSLGHASFPGLGECLWGSNKGHLLFGGPFPDVSQFCNPVSGAFTFEAVVKFDINPLGTIDAALVYGDNGGGLSVRGWQWRIYNGKMQWNLLAGSAADNFYEVPLPSVGANAAVTGTWYHVAVTYTGYNPTNGDTPNQLTFYWTLLDENRVTADQLGGSFTATRRLDGSYVDGTPYGTSQPNFAVGGSGRNTTSNPGNNEGLIGCIDEVRVSNVARRPTEMAFMVGGAGNPPSITQQPPGDVLVGYGQTLVVPALVSGTPPLAYQWLHEGTNVPGQTDMTLVIPNVTFAQAGRYQLVITNAYGSSNSTVAQVTVGAVASELGHTGLEPNGAVSSGNIVDPRWTLYQSADPSYLGPNTLVFENAFPLEKASPNGLFSPTNGVSMWTSVAGNQGGVTVNSPAGQYVYRTTFLVDTAQPETLKVDGNLWVNGSVSDILLNGRSTGISLAPGGTLYVANFSITNGFVPGLNTLDFVETLGGAGIAALRVEIRSIGQALPPGLPVILSEPEDQVVRDANAGAGSRAVFAVVAQGRPPLTYQWFSGSAPISGATGRTLVLNEPRAGAQGSAFSVVVRNDSGSVTSRVARLTLVSTNQPPTPPAYNPVSFQNQTLSLPLSRLVQDSRDADGDPVAYMGAETASTNAVQYGTNNIEQVGASLVYYPVEGYVGTDRFTYWLMDTYGTIEASMELLALLPPASQTVPVGGSATFSVGVASVPAGYAFQWQLNGTNIPGATTAQWTVTHARIDDAGSYRLVVTNKFGQPYFSPVAGLTVGTPGNGTGLRGDYYAYGNGTTNFVGAPALSRVDATVDFDWGTGAPDPALPVDYFMVRWHGQVQPLYSDTYTFSTTTDDGVRLWVNGQLLINRWQNQGATTYSGTIPLLAGEKYDLVMEYYENTSPASARLAWSSLHQPAQIIPASQLYPAAGSLQPRLTAAISGTNLVLDWPGTFSLQAAPEVTGPWSTITAQRIGPFSTNATSAARMFYRLITP